MPFLFRLHVAQSISKGRITLHTVYNTLPNIRCLFDVPEANAGDIADLQKLLDKYDLSDKVRIKLVHIHFRLEEGEVFAARDVEIPKHGAITIMQPLVTAKHKQLFGYHYFVDDDGNLSAYEYMEFPGPDLSDKQAFVQEFCQLVKDRGLQRELGLFLRHADDHVSTHELEYPARRVCIDVPYEIPLPPSEDSFDTMTEFMRDWPKDAEGRQIVGDSEMIRNVPTKSHSHHVHHRHTDRNHSGEGDLTDAESFVSDGNSSDAESLNGLTVSYGFPREIELAGSKLDSTSGLFEVVSYLADNV